VRPHEAATLLATTNAVALDVREEREWRTGRLSASIHIPLAELGSRMTEVPSGHTILVVCRSGNRSGLATTALRRAGYRAENLEGGLTAWKAAGLTLDAGAARSA
jgi:rhodanese-related sulfurtransferase